MRWWVFTKLIVVINFMMYVNQIIRVYILNLYSAVFVNYISLKLEKKTYMGVSCRLYANTTPFYIRDLSTWGFCYLWGVLQPMPHGYWGTTVYKYIQFYNWDIYAPDSWWKGEGGDACSHSPACEWDGGNYIYLLHWPTVLIHIF